MYRIEHNIKMISTLSKYPFHRMEIGDSFKFARKEAKAVGIGAQRFGSFNKMKFATQYSKNEGRCWRTK